jgi:hypothetical protein
MVVNFYEEKEKKAKRCREATFICCQTQLSGEIYLKIYEKKYIAFYTPFTFVEN